MDMKKLLICVVVGMLLIPPVLAEFRGRQGEKVVYELFQDNVSSDKVTSYTEGRFRIGDVVARRFSMAYETGGKVYGYLDSKGKPVRLEIYSSNSTKADITVAFSDVAATMTYTAPESAQMQPQQQGTQTVTIDITPNTYESTFYMQSFRYLPIKVGYTKSFQMFDPTIAIIMPGSALMNATLSITGKEKLTIGGVAYDCYKGTVTTEIPQFLQSLMQMLGQDPITESITTVWLRTSDLLLMREYTIMSMSMKDPQTATTQDSTSTSERKLVSLSYV